MFKAVGVICILAGCVGYGANRVERERSRIAHLKELLSIVRRIQDEISYGKHTLPEICMILAECSKMPYRTAFRQICEQAGRGDGISVARIWAEQIGQCQREAPHCPICRKKNPSRSAAGSRHAGGKAAG